MCRDDEVRLIAYDIWENEGRPNGHDLEHWFRAQAICRQREDQAEAEESVAWYIVGEPCHADGILYLDYWTC